MSAFEVCNVVLEKLNSGKYDVIVINFANPDMVGHTGLLDAAVTAAQTVDQCVGKILKKVKQLAGAAVITADHGNFERMWDKGTEQSHTAHTTDSVPLIVFDERNKKKKLRSDGILADVVPTLLHMMNLSKPKEMTGQSLFK